MSVSTVPACVASRAGNRFDLAAEPAVRSVSPSLRDVASRAARTRRTVSRNQVLGAIARTAPNAISRKEIFRRMKLAGSAISLSSVYRVVDELVRTGEVLCEWSGKREALYRIKPSHFDVCELAITGGADGRTVTIKDRALLARLLAVANQHGFGTAGGEISFRLVEPEGQAVPRTAAERQSA
ncbi:MAG: transcriptional repressor [Burkholderiaceae bacterium]